MNALLPEKENLPRKVIKFYRKVFLNADEKCQYTYKSKIYAKIKNLPISELRWKIIKS